MTNQRPVIWSRDLSRPIRVQYLLDFPPPGVHDLDDTVGGAGQGQGDEDDDDAAEDVGNLGALEVVIA